MPTDRKHLIALHRQSRFILLPLVVSLSRARNVPLWFPWDSRIRSASLRPILPKYHLAEEKQSERSVGAPASPAGAAGAAGAAGTGSKMLPSAPVKCQWLQPHSVHVTRRPNTNALSSFASSSSHFALSGCSQPTSVPTNRQIDSFLPPQQRPAALTGTGVFDQTEQTGSKLITGLKKRVSM